MFDYVIAGAGFAGSVMAHKIATELDKKVLIIEKRKHIAGNCYDLKDHNDILVHRYGPHLFHTNNKKVFDFLSQFTSWRLYHHKVLAMIDGKKVPIPFNLNTLHEVFPATLAHQLEEKLLDAYPYNTKVPILELKQSEDKGMQFLADFIYESIFVNYTAKQWGMKPEEMDGAVTARVPVFVGRDDRYFNDAYQGVPEEGYTKLVEKMLDHPNIKIMLQTDFKEVCSVKDEAFFLFDQPFEGTVIYTGQIDELFDYQFGELPYRSVRMAFETMDCDCFQEAGTVNYPNNYDFTRITEFKYLHPSSSQRTTILKEYPQPYQKGKNTPYYPIFTDQNRQMYEQYAAYSKRFPNLLLLGRLAEYQYYDMDDMVEKALEMFESRLQHG
jgi:UDP-galactopyranose mutase